MKNIYFTPGPSQAYPNINNYLKEAIREEIYSISHRSEKFENIYQDSVNGLRNLLNIPNSYHVVFLSSATEAMERIIQNTVFRNSFHIIAGAFGEKFYEIAKDLNKNTQKFEFDIQSNTQEIKVNDEAELICITQNETSNGFSFPSDLLYQLKDQYTDKLIALDITSSAPYDDLDYKKLDLVFFSVQKGFGMPSGLAILVISPQAFEKAKHLKSRGVSIGSYHNFLNLVEFGNKSQTYETPNALNLYLLNCVLEDMIKLDIEEIRKNIKSNAKLIYKYSEEIGLKPYIKIKKFRSDTVIVLENDRAKEFIENLKNMNLIIGEGYGGLKNKTIRIANFPSHSKEDCWALINEIKSYYKV